MSLPLREQSAPARRKCVYVRGTKDAVLGLVNSGLEGVKERIFWGSGHFSASIGSVVM